MARKIALSFLALLVAFCIGLSLIAMAGAALVVTDFSAAPTQGFSALLGQFFL